MWHRLLSPCLLFSAWIEVLYRSFSPYMGTLVLNIWISAILLHHYLLPSCTCFLWMPKAQSVSKSSLIRFQLLNWNNTILMSLGLRTFFFIHCMWIYPNHQSQSKFDHLFVENFLANKYSTKYYCTLMKAVHLIGKTFYYWHKLKIMSGLKHCKSLLCRADTMVQKTSFPEAELAKYRTRFLQWCSV